MTVTLPDTIPVNLNPKASPDAYSTIKEMIELNLNGIIKERKQGEKITVINALYTGKAGKPAMFSLAVEGFSVAVCEDGKETVQLEHWHLSDAMKAKLTSND